MQKVQTFTLCDICHADGVETDGKSHVFAFDSQMMTVELCDEHAALSAKSFVQLFTLGRKADGRRLTPRKTSQDTADIRAWAKTNKIKLATRGRIPQQVQTQYQEALASA